jgi:hypothetical protein
VRQFSTYGAKAIAGLGKVADTVEDRGVKIELSRRTRDEPVERFRRRDVLPEANELVERLEQVAAGHIDTLAQARPDLPDELDDRAQEVWEPLLAIADHAGAEHSRRAREAAITLSGFRGDDDESLGVRLLADIRQVFDDRGDDRLRSSDLIEALAEIVDAPWGDWHGKPMTAQRIAQQLKPFRVRTREIWVENRKQRGYSRSQFEEAWARYLPPPTVEVVEGVDPAEGGAIGLPPPTALPDWPGRPVPLGGAPPTTSTASTDPAADEPACRFPAHESEWITVPGGRRICQLCHPGPLFE